MCIINTIFSAQRYNVSNNFFSLNKTNPTVFRIRFNDNKRSEAIQFFSFCIFPFFFFFIEKSRFVLVLARQQFFYAILLPYDPPSTDINVFITESELDEKILNIIYVIISLTSLAFVIFNILFEKYQTLLRFQSIIRCLDFGNSLKNRQFVIILLMF